MKKFYFSSINLGCTKNLIDTQYLLGNILTQANNNPNFDIQYFSDPYDKNVSFVFLNTCGFIKSGRDEMFETINKLLDENKKVYLLGCGLQYFEKTDLSPNPSPQSRGEQKTRKKVFSNPNIFAISRDDIDNISLKKLLDGYRSDTYGDFHNLNTTRAFTNIDLGFEYCKIAEGCNNLCSFCIIPKIRGKQKSKPVKEILSEIQNMIKQGAKEIILIAQDTTRYGTDIYSKPYLLELLKKINGLDGDFMFRVLYLYPDILTELYLDEFAKLEKFIPYFDIPLQHISNNLLKSMGRFYDTKKIYKLLEKIKKVFPISYIRTNIIIGFPGEIEENVKELKNFIKKGFFDNVALFEYHDEPFATSSKLPNKIPNDEIRQRFLLIKKEREEVSKKNKNNGSLYINQDENSPYNRGYVVDRDEKKATIRPWLHAPDIDSTIEVPLSNLYQLDEEFAIGSRVQRE